MRTFRWIGQAGLGFRVALGTALAVVTVNGTAVSAPGMRSSTWGRIKTLFEDPPASRLTLGDVSPQVSETEARAALLTLQRELQGTSFSARMSVSLAATNGVERLYLLEGKSFKTSAIAAVHVVSGDGRYIFGFHVDLVNTVIYNPVTGERIWAEGMPMPPETGSDLGTESFSSNFQTAACSALAATVSRVCTIRMSFLGGLATPVCLSLGPVIYAGCMEAGRIYVQYHNPFPGCPDCPTVNHPQD